MKSRFFHHPPDPRAYSAGTIWTDDGYKLLSVLNILLKLRIIEFSHCFPDRK